MARLRLLVTGVTGYIGGSVLTTLLASKYDIIKDLEISVLVRGEEKSKILAEHGVNTILFQDLDESEVLLNAASEHDVVINCASGFHSGAAKALILGLSRRKSKTGKDVFFFHTTGTSNLGDKPLTKEYFEPRIFSDTDKIYTYLKTREALEPYAQRTTDLVAIETGLEVGVRTYLIMSPTIYGIGTGLFNRVSIQLPTVIRSAIKTGQVGVNGPGNGVWDAVHIADLCLLYELLLAKALAGDEVPYGKRGIFFSETGDYNWLQLSRGLANELYQQDILETKEVKHLSLKEAADLWSNGNLQYSELGFASNSRSRADLSRELGWKPAKNRMDFFNSFKEEVKTIAAEFGRSPKV